MNTRMLAALGLATAAVLALALHFVDRRGDEIRPDGERALVPGLKDRVNEIDAIDIIDAGGDLSVQLRRERDRWRVRERHDHEADFALIHEVLRQLAGARRLKARTSNPQWYSRLGLADPGQGDGSGVLLRWPEADLPGVIVGDRDPARVGRYVRLEGEAQTWLADRDIELGSDPMDWLQRAVMDIPADDIERLSIRHPDGEVVELRAADETGETWVLLDAPADRQVRPAWRLRQSADTLARLNFENVRPHESVPEDAIEAVFVTREGLRFNTRIFSEDDSHWVHFSVAEEAPAGDGGGNAAQPGAAPSVDAVAVDGRLSPWQYAIDGARFERMTRRLEDLLEPEENSEEK